MGNFRNRRNHALGKVFFPVGRGLLLTLILTLTLMAPRTVSLQAAGGALSAKEATAIVKNLPEVKQELAAGGPKRRIELNAEEPNRYVFRLVLYLKGEGGDPPRATCVGWYAVDKAARKAYSFVPGSE